MVDVARSKWLQGMSGYVESEKKKNRREMIICEVVMLGIGITGLYAAFFAYMLWGIPLGFIMIGTAVILPILNIVMEKM